MADAQQRYRDLMRRLLASSLVRLQTVNWVVTVPHYQVVSHAVSPFRIGASIMPEGFVTQTRAGSDNGCEFDMKRGI